MAAQAEAAKVTMAFDQAVLGGVMRSGRAEEELDKGADVNGKGPGGPRAAACRVCERPRRYEGITREGADTTLANDAGNTPARYAAQQKQAACLKLVLTDSLKKQLRGR